MLDLTDGEFQFLAEHGLEAGDVFDGRLLPPALRKAGAKEDGKTVVLRDPARSVCGHRLTTRAGHCVQCDTSKLAYERRHEQPALVYIAGSTSLRVVKVGVTLDAHQRLSNLNSQAYGGARDWEMLFHVGFNRAGAVENRTQQRLKKAVGDFMTIKDGREQSSIELFQNTFTEALTALSEAAQTLRLRPLGQAWKSPDVSKY